MIRECNMSVQASNDDLMHWKYIKKKKGKNGKWIYYYNDTDLKRYERSGYDDRLSSTTTAKYQNGKTVVSKDYYRKTNDLFGGTTRTTTVSGGKNVVERKTNYHEQGKVDRLIAKGEKFLFDKIFSKLNQRNQTKDNSKKRKFINSSNKIARTVKLKDVRR